MIRPEEFVPDIVRRRDSLQPWSEWLEGAVLFADVSGFTPMAEALSPLGAEGGEVLTRILLIEGYEKYVGAHQDVVPVFLQFTKLLCSSLRLRSRMAKQRRKCGSGY